LRELVLQILLDAEVVRLDVRLEIVDPALERIEADQRVVDPIVVQALANVEPALCRLVPREDRPLPLLRVRELLLEPDDVGRELVQAVRDGAALLLERLRGLLDPRPLGERRLREVLAVLVERELGLRLPVLGLALQALELPRDLLLVGDRSG